MSNKIPEGTPDNLVHFKSKKQLETEIFQQECDDAIASVREGLNTLEEGNDEISSMTEKWKEEDKREKRKIQMGNDTRMI